MAGLLLDFRVVVPRPELGTRVGKGDGRPRVQFVRGVICRDQHLAVLARDRLVFCDHDGATCDSAACVSATSST